MVGSRPEAEEGRVSLSAASENLIENAGCPVLVVPRGKALEFDGHVVAPPSEFGQVGASLDDGIGQRGACPPRRARA